MNEWLRENSPEVWDSLASPQFSDHIVGNYGSSGSQVRRMEALMKLPLRAGDRLIDFGCGTGRLADLLDPEITYEGIDWSAGIVEEARRRRPEKIFRVGSISDLTEADWVVACGPFNISKGWDKDRTADAVRAMWAAAQKGIGLSLFSADAPDRLSHSGSDVLRYLEGCDWSQLELDRSYLPNDLCARVWR